MSTTGLREPRNGLARHVNHIDLYDQPAFVTPAVSRIAEWMAEYL